MWEWKRVNKGESMNVKSIKIKVSLGFEELSWGAALSN